MYCSSCGTEVTQGLSYCNRCGNNLMPSESFVSIDKPKGLAIAIPFGFLMITGIAIGGLAVVFAFIMELFRREFPIDSLMGLAIFGLLMLFGIAALLSRQLSRLISAYLETSEHTEKPKKTKLNLKKQPTEIAAPLTPVMSVTEHTTRTLDPIYKE
jgi:hypothetical protein